MPITLISLNAQKKRSTFPVLFVNSFVHIPVTVRAYYPIFWVSTCDGYSLFRTSNEWAYAVSLRAVRK